MSEISEFKIVTSIIYGFQVLTMVCAIFCAWNYWENSRPIELLTTIFMLFSSFRSFQLGQLYRQSFGQKVLDAIERESKIKLNRRTRRKLERLTKKR